MEYEDIPQPDRTALWEKAITLLDNGFTSCMFAFSNTNEYDKNALARIMAVEMYKRKLEPNSVR